MFPNHSFIASNPNLKVSSLIVNGQWTIHEDFQQFFNIDQLPVPRDGADVVIWCNIHSGQFTVVDAMKKISSPMPKLHWYKKIWNHAALPSTTTNIWKITRGACATDENLIKKGFNMVSRCYICKNNIDSLNHILWNFNFSKLLWRWLGGIFHFLNPLSFEDVLKLSKTSSPMIKEIWAICSYTLMVELWFLRNNICYDEDKPNFTKIQYKL
ncbi:uncharacterized protein LOC113279232 [Papaver somniferum]|uniref:uncharacterized protein LOC113279232 n=1 Tax=Papaver somniferum TaxID=3469 RepID=UPI000E704C1D|nr:uncharacterized protein LOC113279232 [Papaver somniferum]